MKNIKVRSPITIIEDDRIIIAGKIYNATLLNEGGLSALTLAIEIPDLRIDFALVNKRGDGSPSETACAWLDDKAAWEIVEEETKEETTHVKVMSPINFRGVIEKDKKYNAEVIKGIGDDYIVTVRIPELGIGCAITSKRANGKPHDVKCAHLIDAAAWETVEEE